MLNKAFLASGFWVSARYILLAASGVILTLGFARLAPKETLGQYQFVLSLLAIFSVFSLPGLNMAALRSVSQKKPKAVITAVDKSFRSSWLAVPLLIGYGLFLARAEPVLGRMVIASSLLFPFFYAPNTWYAYFEGRSFFKPVAVKTVLASFAVTAAVLMALYLKANSFWLVLVFLGLSSLFSWYYFFQVKKNISEDKKQSGEAGIDERYGRRVTAQKFVFTLSESLPALAITYLFGATALAGFQVANVFLAGVSGLIGALAIISLPQFFQDSTSNHQNVLKQSILTGLISSLGYFLAVQAVFIPMYGQNYHDSFKLAQLLVALPLVISLRTFWVNYLTSRDKSGLIITVYALGNILALAVFIIVSRMLPLLWASATYLYALNLLLALPLGAYYFLTAFRKTFSNSA